MAKVTWTSEAERWLKDIHDYIAQDNPGAAAKVVNGIFQKVQLLAKFPETGHKFRTEPEGEVRILLYGHYRIAYLWVDEKDVVILGVFHGALDINRYLL
ncbi:type II toxin-antitoxin system RelE/ParE family toxin [Geoalkalibacter halelectricus]|uniref:Type II toxin-antitoxin system RelE/ParE family toxin n=1 Tax=Geoalkalibacter halelectricus TaxID=2847045 RepID=A0ABY5ZKH3_9BACT|nr:type II toxin-antitoxin system RelE/ParE family toxin [Geoalkalibacter halelectricus]MDO3379713.1 type II toxin-antitoxin system RelE/ParE family toxin [Geoalkalibacter halelectricus]UWZ79677.1 type II toxin-antitoxin system RelE/ParE family toxin [Geoalkalibacter halelectricus]